MNSGRNAAEAMSKALEKAAECDFCVIYVHKLIVGYVQQGACRSSMDK